MEVLVRSVSFVAACSNYEKVSRLAFCTSTDLTPKKCSIPKKIAQNTKHYFRITILMMLVMQRKKIEFVYSYSKGKRMFARLLHSVSTFREWMAGAFVFVTSKICLEKGTNFHTHHQVPRLTSAASSTPPRFCCCIFTPNHHVNLYHYYTMQMFE